MCGCFVLLLGAFAPRLALALMALFNDEITKAFDGSWIIPLIGWFLLPYTTLAYVLISWWTAGASRVRVVLRGAWRSSSTSGRTSAATTVAPTTRGTTPPPAPEHDGDRVRGHPGACPGTLSSVDRTAARGPFGQQAMPHGG